MPLKRCLDLLLRCIGTRQYSCTVEQSSRIGMPFWGLWSYNLQAYVIFTFISWSRDLSTLGVSGHLNICTQQLPTSYRGWKLPRASGVGTPRCPRVIRRLEVSTPNPPCRVPLVHGKRNVLNLAKKIKFLKNSRRRCVSPSSTVRGRPLRLSKLSVVELNRKKWWFLMSIRPPMSTRDWWYVFIQGQYLNQLWEVEESSCELCHFQVLKAHIPITIRHSAMKSLTICFFLVQLCIEWHVVSVFWSNLLWCIAFRKDTASLTPDKNRLRANWVNSSD